MRKLRVRGGLAISVLCAWLSACNLDPTAATPDSAQNTPPVSATPPAAPTPPGAPSVTPPNIAPVISGTPPTTVVAGMSYLFQPTATDGDGDTLTFIGNGLPSWLTIDPRLGTVSGSPAAADVGTTADIQIGVSDGETSAALPMFRITITAVPAPPPPPPPVGNVAPTINGSPASSVQATMAYAFTPAAVDPDSPNLTFSIANRPTWASFSSATGALTGTPTAAQTRAYNSIVISVSDGALSASLPAFSINVTAAPNRAPAISGSPVTTATVGAAYAFAPTASDPDGQTLGYAISNKPSWASFSTATGRLSGTPASSNVGTFSNVTITVSDGVASASLAPFNITVSAAPNGAPTISGSPSQNIVAGSAYNFMPTASDPNGDALTFSITGKPAWASFSTSTGALTGTPSAAQTGTYSNIVISVSDGTVTQSLAGFSINVTALTSSGSATLTWTAPSQNTDGSALTDLGGYRIYHGTSASALDTMIQVTSAGATSYVVDNLASGAHYFAIAAYNSAGSEGARSGVGSKTIP
jgi:hypothetical protein